MTNLLKGFLLKFLTWIEEICDRSTKEQIAQITTEITSLEIDSSFIKINTSGRNTRRLGEIEYRLSNLKNKLKKLEGKNGEIQMVPNRSACAGNRSGDTD